MPEGIPPSVTLLGTGAAYPPPDRENTSLLLAWSRGLWLIDCGASPHRRIRLAGHDPGDLRGILITHGHPDHLYGLPSLVHCLLGEPRRDPLPLLAPPLALRRARQLLETFDLLERDGLELDLIEVPLDVLSTTVIHEVEGLEIHAAAVEHGHEAVGVRAVMDGRVLACSGDTMPCAGVDELARGAHTLVHESTLLTRAPGEPPGGHSSVDDAARAAARAGAEQLILVHFLETTVADPDSVERQAAALFDGRTVVGEDLATYPV